MQVKSYREGRERIGLHIGEANAHRYFRKGVSSIELRLDDLHIQCTLPPDFWQGHPEIHDPRLSEWLEFKAARLPGREPVLLSMVLSGAGTFVVRPESDKQAESFGADVTSPRKSPSP